MGDIDEAPAYTLTQFEACPDDALWRARIHKRLFDAGLLDSATPERSPIRQIQFSYTRLPDGEHGNRKLEFMLAGKCSKRTIEGPFQPYKAARFHDEFLFRIPLSFFER
jgi:hypothetical protein